MEIMKHKLGKEGAGDVSLRAGVAGRHFCLRCYQFAMAEVTASIATRSEVYFMSSSTGNLVEDKTEVNYVNLFPTVTLAACVVGSFLFRSGRARAGESVVGKETEHVGYCPNKSGSSTAAVQRLDTSCGAGLKE